MRARRGFWNIRTIVSVLKNETKKLFVSVEDVAAVWTEITRFAQASTLVVYIQGQKDVPEMRSELSGGSKNLP